MIFIVQSIFIYIVNFSLNILNNVVVQHICFITLFYLHTKYTSIFINRVFFFLKTVLCGEFFAIPENLPPEAGEIMTQPLASLHSANK